MIYEYKLKDSMKVEFDNYTYHSQSKYGTSSFGCMLLDRCGNPVVHNDNIKVSKSFELQGVIDKVTITHDCENGYTNNAIIKIYKSNGELIESTSFINLTEDLIFLAIFVRTKELVTEHHLKLKGGRGNEL